MSDSLDPAGGDLERILPALARKTHHDDWRTFEPSRVRRDCSIHFLVSGTHAIPKLVVKAYKRDAARENMARHIHQRGVRFHEVATPEFGVPDPLFLMPQHNALAMGYVDAPTLGSRLLRAMASKAARHELIRRAAAWLAWFYQRGQVRPEPFVPGKFGMKFDRLHGVIESAAPGSLAGDVFLRECLALTSRLAGELDGRVMPHAPAHGDFTPFNLFADGGRTIGFDFGAVRILPVHHDISRFLMYLGIYRPLAPRTSELTEFGCAADDLELFLSVFSPGERLDVEVWRRMQFIEISRRLLALKPLRGNLWKQGFRSLQASRLRHSAHCLMKTLG
jgi:Phosphotransferase enzyme family